MPEPGLVSHFPGVEFGGLVDDRVVVTVCLVEPVVLGKDMLTETKVGVCGLHYGRECVGAPYFPVAVAQVQKYCEWLKFPAGMRNEEDSPSLDCVRFRPTSGHTSAQKVDPPNVLLILQQILDLQGGDYFEGLRRGASSA